MATLISSGPATIYINGQPIGTVSGVSLAPKMVPVLLGGLYPDGSEANPVDILAPENVVAQGAQAVFDWWIEDLKAKRGEDA